MASDPLPCPFCGSCDIDPRGWMALDCDYGPQCQGCGATADSLPKWNKRAPPEVSEPSREELASDAALERAAKVADEYASVNIEAAQDSILHDPLFHGAKPTPEAFENSEKLMIDGCVHSSMFHAAQNIAAAIRELKANK